MLLLSLKAQPQSVLSRPPVRGTIMLVGDISEIGVQEMRLCVTVLMHTPLNAHFSRAQLF